MTKAEPATRNSVHFHDVHGHHLAYIAHDEGQAGTPILFIHGLTASVRFWEAAMLDYVRQHHPWYSISLPFHHPSTFPADYKKQGLSEDLFCELLHGMKQHLVGDRPVILVGYSLGAFAALIYAAKRSAHVRGVVSVGGFASGRARGLEAMLQELSRGHFLRPALFHLGWRVMQLHPFFLKLAVRQYACNDRALLVYPYLDPTLALIFPDVRRHDVEAMRLLFHYLLDMNILDEIQHITMPVLAFAGECDPIIPYSHQAHYAERLANCTFVSLPNTGHVAFAESPEKFERGLVEWLRGLSS